QNRVADHRRRGGTACPVSLPLSGVARRPPDIKQWPLITATTKGLPQRKIGAPTPSYLGSIGCRGAPTLSAMSGASLSQDALYTDAERQRLPTSATLLECGALGFAHVGKTHFSLSTGPETVAPPPPSPRPPPCRQPETASPHTSPLRPDSARHADLARRGKE